VRLVTEHNWVVDFDLYKVLWVAVVERHPNSPNTVPVKLIPNVLVQCDAFLLLDLLLILIQLQQNLSCVNNPALMKE